MSFARAWTRQLFGACGAAVLVPGTVACALAVLALAGGFARLGSLATQTLETVGAAGEKILPLGTQVPASGANSATPVGLLGLLAR